MDVQAQKLLPVNNLTAYKIHMAKWNGREQPLDAFVRSWDEWVEWNSWRGGRDDFARPFILSLIRFYQRPDKWLFGGIFRVIDRNPDRYGLELCDQHQEYIGRLLIHYPDPGFRGRAFYLEKHFGQLTVAELLEKPYTGEAFCGYEAISHDFSQLEPIFKQGKPDWKAALENVKGVYLIVDKGNGKTYVGSAYGASGVWSRWACYMGTGHGWNDELTKLIDEKGISYAREHFKFSLLECFSMKTDDNVIISREQHWKRALLSGVFGYNKN